MKRLTALLCLINLLIASVTAQNLPPSKKTIKAEYGLDSEKSYSSDEVAILLQITEEEAKLSIKKAYAEGYKAGLLEAVPESVRLETLNKQLKADLLHYQTQIEKQNELNRILVPLYITLGAVGGFAVRGITWKY
ncbi:MAG: hypothetical protein GX297_07540 [Treponema sp.]|nr:hypothetical protein [Treponema sp.]